MEEKDFERLVERLEVYAQKHPTAYKLRVAALAAAGYFALVGTVVGVVLLVAGCIFFVAEFVNFAVLKFLIIPLGIGALVLRSLWVKFPKPEGYRLREVDAPKLFEMLKRIRTATKGPEVHHVFLTPEFNASMSQHPRLGIFGWYENCLRIGLPLLHALSPDEVRAVIAHEFGHLSRKHSVGSGWIYRVRQTWIQVLVNSQQSRTAGSGFFRSLFNFYVPYFSAYSCVLMRAMEFEADRFAVILAGKQNAARALIKLQLKQRAMEDEFWPGFLQGAETEPYPPHDVFVALIDWLRQPLTAEQAQRWFAQSLTDKHHFADSHPALGDRLEAIGYPEVRLIADIELFAKNCDQYGNEYFLRKAPVDLIDSWNADWREDLGERWEEIHKVFKDSKKSLVHLDAKAEIRDLTIDERLERAKLTAKMHGKIAVIPLLQEIVALEPDHAVANYVLGEGLLEQGDEAGIKHVERAMEKDMDTVIIGCEAIFQFLAGKSRMVEAEKYRTRQRMFQDKLERAREERKAIRENDRFKSHGVEPQALVALRQQLAKHSDLASAHLVQKVVKYFPEEPSFVLGIIRKRAWHESQDNNLDMGLINRLSAGLSLPGLTLIIALERNYRPLREVFHDIRGAEIYRAVA
jgi:Zn-dependent protease with chaperone function